MHVFRLQRLCLYQVARISLFISVCSLFYSHVCPYRLCLSHYFNIVCLHYFRCAGCLIYYWFIHFYVCLLLWLYLFILISIINSLMSFVSLFCKCLLSVLFRNTYFVCVYVIPLCLSQYLTFYLFCFHSLFIFFTI